MGYRVWGLFFAFKLSAEPDLTILNFVPLCSLCVVLTVGGCPGDRLDSHRCEAKLVCQGASLIGISAASAYRSS